MGHNLGVQAAKAVQKSEKKQAQALRTPAERLKDIRLNLESKNFVTPTDQRWLLELLDAAIAQLAEDTQTHQTAMQQATLEIAGLKDQIEQFRSVYEQENRSTTVNVERNFPGETTQVRAAAIAPYLLQPEVVGDVAASVAQKAGVNRDEKFGAAGE